MAEATFRIQAHRKLLRQRSQQYGRIGISLPVLPEPEDQYQKGWNDCQTSVTAYLKHQQETAPPWPSMAAMIFRLKIEQMKPDRQP